MKYSGKTGVFVPAAALLLLLFSACGGDNGGSRSPDNQATSISISVSPSAEIRAGSAVTLTVNVTPSGAAFNWPSAAEVQGDYTPPASGNQATWRPPATAGSYRFTVTSADRSKSGAATVTVLPDIEFDPSQAEEIDAVVIENDAGEVLERRTFTFTALGGWNASIADVASVNNAAASLRASGAAIMNDSAGCYIEGQASGAGAGTYTVTIVCRQNLSGGSRLFELVISTDYENITIQITQKPALLWSDPVAVNHQGARHTELYGINNDGWIIGEFYDSSTGIRRAFVRNGGVDTLIAPDMPGSVYALGINDAGRILGHYEDGYFLRTENGEYRNIGEYPEAYRTYYTGLNNADLLVGYRMDSNGYARGFIKNGETFTEVAHPDASSAGCALYRPCGTIVTGINNAGHLVGHYTDSAGYARGFLRNDGGYTTIDYPDDPRSMTYVEGINNSGLAAGYFYDSAGYARGFVRDEGRFIVIEHPVAKANADISAGTYIYGINDGNRIAGWFDDGEKSQGFSLSR